jgi:hypothetical protein
MPEESPQDIDQLLNNSQPFDVDSATLKEAVTRELTPFTVAGKTIFIKDTLADPYTTITPEDGVLKLILENLISELSAQPTINQIVDVIHQNYPRDTAVTAYTRNYRHESDKAMPLGKYFQSQDEVPYSAVCVHKALLGQALLSFYGYSSGLINFGFRGQINYGISDGEAGMHSVLRTETDNKMLIADPHKGICESESDYFKRFDDFQIFDPIGTEVFVPER